MDFLAVTSWGAYPTPTPSGAKRAICAVSYGLLVIAPSAIPPTFRRFGTTTRSIVKG